MTVEYSFEYEDVQKLQKQLEKIPDNVENIINTYLHKEGAGHTEEDITKLIKVSKPHKPKTRHARRSKWSKVEPFNLGFVLKARGGAANKPRSFGYLVFPNEGRGPRNPIEQRFMERGLQRSVDDVLTGLSQVVETEIERVLS